MFQGVGLSKIGDDCAPGFSAGRSLIVAHRGSTQGLPENSIPAIAASSYLPTVEGLELDVRSTRDGVQVLMHDTTVDRTTRGSGSVAKVSYAQLGSYGLRWADGQEDVPTLSTALKKVPHSKIAFVELKQGSNPLKVLSIVRSRPAKSVYVISSSRKTLMKVEKHAPSIRRGLVWGGGQPADFWRSIQETRPSAIILNSSHASDYLLAELAQRKIDVFVWTVNDPAEMRKWMSDGNVKGVITDYPEKAVQIRTSLRCTV